MKAKDQVKLYQALIRHMAEAGGLLKTSGSSFEFSLPGSGKSLHWRCDGELEWGDSSAPPASSPMSFPGKATIKIDWEEEA